MLVEIVDLALFAELTGQLVDDDDVVLDEGFEIGFGEAALDDDVPLSSVEVEFFVGDFHVRSFSRA